MQENETGSMFALQKNALLFE